MMNEIKELLKGGLILIVAVIIAVISFGSLYVAVIVTGSFVEYGLCRIGANNSPELLTPDGKCKPPEMRD
jgi:hypothetical protein